MGQRLWIHAVGMGAAIKKRTLATCLKIDSFFAPDRMQRTLHYMIHYDLLGSYQQMNGIHQALCGIEWLVAKTDPLSG